MISPALAPDRLMRRWRGLRRSSCAESCAASGQGCLVPCLTDPVRLHATRWLVGVNYVAAEVSTFTPGRFPWLSVNRVAADLSTIRKVCPGTRCQLCRDFGHSLGHSLGRKSGFRRIRFDCSNNPRKHETMPLPAKVGEAFPDIRGLSSETCARKRN